MSLPHRLFCVAVVLVAAGCDDPFELPPALFENVVDTTTIFALRGTAITLPSAFDIVGNSKARTDRAEPFDFAFDIDSTGQPVVLPAGALGLTAEAGLIMSDTGFDALVTAPVTGYVIDSAVAITTGTVFIGRSRLSNSQCALLGSLPRYGKFRVIEIDTQGRALVVEGLVNENCGFRSLEPGIPTD